MILYRRLSGYVWRRTFLLVVTLIAGVFGSQPGYGETLPAMRIGLLLSGFEPHYKDAEREFMTGMKELGYVEGQNLFVERRYAHLQPKRMASLAGELADLKLDAIVTGCTGSTRAVQRATSSTPIVMASVADPVGQGFVKSISRSGTNVTGRSSQSRELLPKMLELFQIALPHAQQIAVLVNTRNTVHETLWSDALASAPLLNLKLVRIDIDGPADLGEALKRLAVVRAQGLLVLPDDPMAFNNREEIVTAANKLGLPSFYGYREFVESGGLMSYGEKFAESYRHTVGYIDKVVHGTSPSLLPIEQPTQFELVLNLTTAAALSLDLPKALLLRADTALRGDKRK
jgi:putative ABC transport system substrate-binding protein